MNLWVYVLGGFKQRRAANGSISLWEKLERRYSVRGQVFVQYMSWHDSAGTAAEQAWWMRPVDDPKNVKIVICGFSWGGSLAVRLAAQLKRRGMSVEHMILCDPVYRHNYWAGQWRAYVPWSKILIPVNVKQVSWCYQEQTVLRGHRVVAQCPSATEVLNGTKLDADHIYMDDEPWYFQTSCEVIDPLWQQVIGEAE